jgi:serine-aspartate repeat-containing protein C/D/E
MPRSALGRGLARKRRIGSDIEALEQRRLLTVAPALQVAMGSISGIVHSDNVVRDNRWEAGEIGIAGVTLELLDDSGRVAASTQTDAAGQYRFEDVWPGVYAIRELQPENTFHAGEEIGSGGGQMVAGLLEEIEVISGAELTGYNFSELPLGAVPVVAPILARLDEPIAAAFPFVTASSSAPGQRVIDQTVEDEEYFPNSVDGESSAWRLNVLKPPLAKSPGKLMHLASSQANPLRAGRWVLGNKKGESSFGLEGATPLVGDFNGDGRTEIGLYLDGEWLIDSNDNGRWDDEDVTINLGTRSDQPVVGDWNGDGRDDIGVFGPHDAGPVAGDFSGQGRDSIGVFKNGRWQLDLDGDGKLTSSDPTTTFGQSGDVPIVGDFDGDGRDEIGVFRNGQWIIDSNHNGRIDAADKVFELGGAGDLPVVGDFDGDGVDEPGLYRGSPAARISRTR